MCSRSNVRLTTRPGSLGGYFSYMSVSQVLPEIREQILSLESWSNLPETSDFPLRDSRVSPA